jgi:hypothetical protein
MAINPLSANPVFPLEILIAPLEPIVAESALDRRTSPLEADKLCPLTSTRWPPVEFVEDDPAMTTRSPPCPSSPAPDPDITAMDPARPLIPSPVDAINPPVRPDDDPVRRFTFPLIVPSSS